jgi:maltokinase
VVEERALRASRDHLLALDATHAVRVVASERGHRAEPVTASGDGWMRSTPGDGAGLAVLHRLRSRMAVAVGFRVTVQSWVALDDESERVMGVDQTNESWVVGGTLVVKWVTDDLDGLHPGADRMRRLGAAGFAETPTLVGLLEWQNAEGHWAPVAVVQEYLPGAEDGWTWTVSEARRALGLEEGEERRFSRDLGRLTARMHLALAAGAPEIASSEQAEAAYHDALATLDEAVRVTAELDPASHALVVEHRDDIRGAFDAIAALAGQPAWPVHGDFHVGQVLRTPDGRFHVVDFDGNPTRPPALRAAPAPRERDLASMGQSLENVGYVVRHYAPEVDPAAVEAWVDRAGEEFLAGYREEIGEAGSESLLRAFDLEQVCREVVYAARHLPRWMYVPAAALRRRFGET